jgi:hypothetical protein
MIPMPVDQVVAQLLLRYAKLVVARGYVHNSLGNLVIRVPHPDFPHGVAYTKHAEVSLEEMTLDHVVITDIPTPQLLYGTMPTSVGHNCRTRPLCGPSSPTSAARSPLRRRAPPRPPRPRSGRLPARHQTLAGSLSPGPRHRTPPPPP